MKKIYLKLVALALLSVLSVTNAWADNGFYAVYYCYTVGEDESCIDWTSGDAPSTDLDILDGNFVITKAYLKVWDNWSDPWQMYDGGQMRYKINSGSLQYINPASWTRTTKQSNDGDGKNYKLQNESLSTTIARTTDASGSYTMNYDWQAWGQNNNSYLFNDQLASFTWKVRPPEVNGGDFTITSIYSEGGTGEDSDHPMLITNGRTTATFTVTASKAHTDANSVLWVSFDNGSNWSTGENATATTVTSGSKSVSSSVSSFTVKVKFRNDGADLESATTVSKTFYYKEQPAGITIKAGSNGMVKKESGEWGTSAVYSPITLGTSYNIYAKADTHYDFYNWTSDNANSTIVSSTSASTSISVTSGAVTNVTANFVEHPYAITIVGGTESSTTAKIATTGSATANPPVGQYFTNWTVPGTNFTFADDTDEEDETISFTATADGTVTANFGQKYAYVEGRFHVQNAARNSWTNTFNNGNWDISSRNIKFDYDDTNHRFELHTYAKPSELTSNIDGQIPWFNITTSRTNSEWSSEIDYYATGTGTIQELSTAGSSYKKATQTSGSNRFKFNSSAVSGYVVLYFDESNVWYTLEQRLEYDGNGNDGGSTPDANNTYYANGTTTNAATNTFTKTGYTFVGWDTDSSGDGSDYAEGDEITMSADVKLYAIWRENISEIDISTSTGGSITGSGTDVELGVTTKQAISATADPGYYFVRWDVTGNAAVDNANSASTNATTDGADGGEGSITAVFALRYAVIGSLVGSDSPGSGMPGWSDYSKTMDYNATNDFRRTLCLEGNKTYKFRLRDLKDNCNLGWKSDGTTTLNASETTFNETTGDVKFATDGSGDITFKIVGFDNGYPQVRVLCDFTSSMVTYNNYSYYVDGTSNTETTGGSISSAIDGNSYIVASGNKVKNGGSMTFTADITDGYTFDGWYTDNDFEDGDKISAGGNYAIDGNTLTVSSISADLAIYAKFVENSTAVTIAHNEHGHVEISDVTVTNTTVGKTTTRTIKAVPNPGYYFAGWTVPAEADFSVDDATEAGNNGSKSTTLRGLGAGTAGTITANFVELEKVYFRNWNEDSNAPLWSQVYVYFSISYENDGSSQTCAKSNSSADFYTEMEQIGSTNIYWAYVPRATTRKINPCDDDIAFSNHNFGTNFKFNSDEAVMRGDYRSGLSLFVPRHASTYSRNGTKYYNGYWKHHNLEPGSLSGYSIERYTGGNPAYEQAADNGADRLHFIVLDDNTIQYSLRVDNVSDGFNKYMIYSDGGIHYVTYNSSVSETGYDITTTNYKDIHMSEYNTGSPRFYITPTTQNIYTLTIDMSGDEMLLTVDYPVALGDYRIVHTYSSTKKAYSDIIKSADAESGVIASMYINTASSPTLTLEKCTGITTGLTPSVTWTPQTQGDVWSYHSSNFDKGNGVYKFNVTITKDASNAGSSINTITNVGIYDGEFYIKTDCAPGGWTAWKANVMEKNTITFDEDDENTFDRSFCHWIDAVRGSAKPMNVKCVIANDYNIAVSDTLVGDAILGKKDDGVTQWENIPAAAHVRFSYNSTTNELKRTYLALEGTDHLILEGNTLSSGTVYMIHDPEGSDVPFTYNKAELSNLSNFTFTVNVEAREKARVRLSAKYNSVVQDLIGETGQSLDGADNAYTVEILGGDIEETGYKPISIIYDFKTNYLMSAWIADGSTIGEGGDDMVLDADLIIMREGQGDARQIKFANSKSLTNIGKVYGVMQFSKSTLNDGSKSVYERDLYWISFPFEVKLSDAFGMGTYGIHWIIERYDGYTRAQKGFWADSPSNWKFITPYQRDSGYVLEANVGYILALDLDELGDGSLVWENSQTNAYLYFPSKDNVGSIADVPTKDVTINQDGYKCTINRGTVQGDRRIKDSYWHCIGVPSYANNTRTTSGSATPDPDPSALSQSTWEASVPFVYRWNSVDNSLAVHAKTDTTFKAMQSYLVQYSSTTLTWTNVTNIPSSIAARLAETPDKEFQLALTYDDEEQDHTYVRLTDETGVTNRFEFNQDLSKEYNAGKANIWTVTADTVEVAGNSMPKPLQTTVVPVGVKVVANGEYTFSMPEGTNGENVVLIDNAYGTRTNLGLTDYTVTLTSGTYDGRFALEFGPIQDAPTGIEQMSTVNYQLSTEEVRKVFVGGRLYIIRDGKVFDATGHRVE